MTFGDLLEVLAALCLLGVVVGVSVGLFFGGIVVVIGGAINMLDSFGKPKGPRRRGTWTL